MSSNSSNAAVEIYVNYLRHPDLKFNLDYYVNQHMPLVARTWGGAGGHLLGWHVVEFADNDPSGVHVRATIRFDSAKAAADAFGNMPPELRNDLPNYSNYPPETSQGKVVGQSKL